MPGQINAKVDYNKSSGKIIGYVTLDPVNCDENWVPCNNDLGEKIFLIVLKGIKKPLEARDGMSRSSYECRCSHAFLLSKN